MRSIDSMTSFVSSVPGRAIGRTDWNRRILVAAVTAILFLATMLALYQAGPEVRAMIASEGMMVSADQ